jgi:hypothetical protein
MGLGTVENKVGATFLTVAGGYVWDRKAPETSKGYVEETHQMKDGKDFLRKGVKHKEVMGKIVGVQFREHDDFGQSINLTIDISTGGGFTDRYILSCGTNNRYGQDVMKYLLKFDVEEDTFFRPYDFEDKVSKKRIQGISFKQGGEKVNLRNEDAPFKDGDWWKTASKNKKTMFFAELGEWFNENIEEDVIPKFGDLPEITSKPKAEESIVSENEVEKSELAEASAEVPEDDNDDLPF